MHIRCWEYDSLVALKHEFGNELQYCYIPFHAKDEDTAKRALDLVSIL